MKGRERNQSFKLESEISVSEAALLAGVSPEEIGLALINGKVVSLDAIISLPCRLSLFSHMTGG